MQEERQFHGRQRKLSEWIMQKKKEREMEDRLRNANYIGLLYLFV